MVNTTTNLPTQAQAGNLVGQRAAGLHEAALLLLRYMPFSSKPGDGITECELI